MLGFIIGGFSWTIGRTHRHMLLKEFKHATACIDWSNPQETITFLAIVTTTWQYQAAHWAPTARQQLHTSATALVSQQFT